MYHVYFAKSPKTGEVYVGATSKEPLQRMNEHNSGNNKWTKANGPFNLIYYEEYLCKEDAFLREKFYKSGIGKKVKHAIVSMLNKKSNKG